MRGEKLAMAVAEKWANVGSVVKVKHAGFAAGSEKLGPKMTPWFLVK